MSKSNDNSVALKLGLFFIIACIYFYIFLLISRCVYQEALFFFPKITAITACINGGIITICSFAISKKTIKWFKNHNKKVLIIFLVFIFLIYPIFFLKAGIVVDDKKISKNNMWGKTKEKYSYSDVESFEMSVKFGVEYDIKFKSGKKIILCSHEVIVFNSFRSENKLQIFDKHLEKNAKRIVYKSIYSTPHNIKRFFRKKEYYDYFNRILSLD